MPGRVASSAGPPVGWQGISRYRNHAHRGNGWRTRTRCMNEETFVTVRVGINGFGRIGRNFFRAAVASGADVEFVGINDLASPKILAHFLKYDTTLGRFPGTVEATDDTLVINGKTIKVIA